MSSWASTLGMKKYQITFNFNVGFTVWANSADEAREAAENFTDDEREHIFIEIKNNGVDWIVSSVESVEEKDE